MPTVTLTSIEPSSTVQNEINSFMNLRMGPNINVINSKNLGKFDIGALPFQTKSIISSTGLNINPLNGISKLTISTEGDLNTLGSISTGSSINSTSLNVGTGNMTVSDTGLVYAANDLTIGEIFKVTASTGEVLSGSLNVNGGITTKKTVKIGGTDSLPAITLANTGIVSISNTLTVGGAARVSDSLGVGGNLGVSGAVTMSDALTVSKAVTMFDTLTVSKAVTMSDTLAVSKAVTMSDTLTVSKAVTMSDTLAVSKAVTMSDTLDVTKDLKVGGNKVIFTASTGSVSSELQYSSYKPNTILTNTDITIHSTAEQNFSSTTNKLLTTQEYVDKEIWKQAKRINTIVGKDSTELDNFNKVYEVITKLAGDSDIVKTLTDVQDKYGSVIDKTSEINVSISDIVSTAYNVIPIACLPTVWQDESPPMPIPYTLTLTEEDGWYFNNFKKTNSDKTFKINWYVPADKGMKVKDIQQLFLNIFAKSNKALPSIHFYTAPKGNSTDFWPGIVNAKVSFHFKADNNPELLSLTANKSYCLYTGNKVPINIYNKIPLPTAEILTVNNNNKNTVTSSQQIDSTIVSHDDTVVLFAIQTYNTFAPSEVECIINSLNIRLSSGTTQFGFNNSSVTSNYLYNFQLGRNSDFSLMSTLYTEYYNSYNSTFINNLNN
jgi:hypothetical protein